MSIYDSTVEMLGMLSEEDLMAVNGVVKRFVYDDIKTPFKPLDENEMLSKLEMARKHIANGQCRDSESFEKDLAEEFDF